jgi:hypothetical protein
MVRKYQLNWILFILFIAVVASSLYWVNYQFAKNNPGGNDFLVHYIGTRSMLFDGLSPYSDEVSTSIQIAAYGHPAQGIEHELRVAYPLYSIILFAPFSIIGDYQVARAIWMTVLELALVAMTFVSFELFEWKPPLWVQGSVLLFSVTWYHAVRGVINGNAVILLALALAAILLFIKNGREKIAGVLLAATTIKPHLVVLVIPLILIWSIYHKRWQLILWFGGTLVGLILIGIVFIPDWIMQNLWEILKYPAYNPAGTLAAVLGEWMPGISIQLKWGIGIFLGLILIYEAWHARKGGFHHLAWTVTLALTITQWIGIQTDPGNFILLFPALILILAEINQKWEVRGGLAAVTILSVLLVGLWVLFVTTIQRTYQPVQGSVMFLPLPTLCLVGLYWIKWWYIGSKPLKWNDFQ